MPDEPLTLDGTGALELRATYDDIHAQEAPRLFEPAPAPMPGQSELFHPDDLSNQGRVDSPAERG